MMATNNIPVMARCKKLFFKVLLREVKRMVNEQYERAKQILSEHKEQHNELAQLLIDKEVIFAAHLVEHLLFSRDLSFFRQIPGSAQGPPAGDDSYLNQWIGIFQ